MLISTFVVVYINTYADSIQNRHWRNLQDVFTDGSSNALIVEHLLMAQLNALVMEQRFLSANSNA